MEEKALYGALTVYRETGAYLRRLEQFEKSKASYDEAYKNAPEDVNLLIGRSQVCADAMKPKQAYADAEDALKLDPRSMQARNVQARALYTMSDFERSVVINYRGSRFRKQPPYFKEGIIQGLETIQDCIGANAGNVMEDFLPLIRQEEAKRIYEDEDVYVPRPHKSRIPHQEHVTKMTQLEKRRHELLARVLAMKYLGPMAYDKFYLQDLTIDRRIPSANLVGSRKIKNIVNESLKSLCERQEMLRSQRPYYTIKLAEKSESKYLTKYKSDLLEKERLVGAETAERNLKEIELCLRESRIMDLMIKAERLQVFLDSKTPHNLPDRENYTDRLYRAVGEGYLIQHRISYCLSESSNRRRVAFLMGLPIGRPKSFDSVIATYPHKFIDLNLAIEKTSETLEMCENSYMRCWLTYEMARMLNTQKNYALAKFYAKRCQRQAQDLESVTWWMNGCFVLMSGDMQQGNLNDIRIAVEEAYEWSKKMTDPERIRAFLAKCYDMACEPISTDEFKVIRQRETQILKVMDDVSKVDTRVLFKRISTLPPGRRFSVLPVKAELTKSTSERRKRKQRGLTVVPGKERELPAAPKSDVAGYQKFEL